MSATNGSSSLWRLRAGALVACMAVLVAMMAVGTSSASASKNPTQYIALGDSISFGYSEELFNNNLPTESPTAFETSGVNYVAKHLAAQERKVGNYLHTDNLACPGETSTGLIGNGPLGQYDEYVAKEIAVGGTTAPCAYHNIDGFPLHTELFPGTSELESAKGIIEASGPSNVKLITINIGSNDELATVGKCENKAYDEAHGFKTVLLCVVAEAPGLFKGIITNTGFAVGTLRATGYTGPIEILGFYNPQSYQLAGSDGLQKKLNEAFACTIQKKCLVEPNENTGETFEVEGETPEAFGPGVVYANPFPLINVKNAHELSKICKYTEECNVNDKKLYLEKATGHAWSAEEVVGYEALRQSKNEAQIPGDIHPTPAGYALLGKVMFAALAPFGI